MPGCCTWSLFFFFYRVFIAALCRVLFLVLVAFLFSYFFCSIFILWLLRREKWMGGWPDPIIGPGGDYRVLFFFSHFLLFFPSIRTSKIATEMEKKILENLKKKNRRRKRRRNLLHSFVRFYLVFFWFYLVWSSCTEFYWLLPSFTGLPSSFFSLPFS